MVIPAGNLDADVWRQLAVGEAVALPALVLGVLSHVHADDVAQAFERAVAHPRQSEQVSMSWPSRQ